MTKLIAITGPSSSGKTKLSIELAKELNGEIISVDSRQIYKELDIGSAKPTTEEREGIPHHLIDIINVNQNYSAADFCDDAEKKIEEIISRNKTVILSGGTGLYFRILLQDFDLPRVAPNENLRTELNKKSSEELYSTLKDLDPKIAEKIHCNNKVKIIRALEVIETLKIPMSQAQKKKQNKYNTLWFGLNCKNRENLYNKINLRCDIMMEKGLLNEAEKLFNKYPENKILLSTIGYQEFYPYFKGETKNLTDCLNKLKQNTRRYAKRQISWFKANKDILEFYTDFEKFENIKDYIIDKYYKSTDL